MLLDGEADIGIATEALAGFEELLALPCYSWSHVVVVPRDHALAQEADRGLTLTLPRLAEFALITYETGYTGRRHIDEAFARHELVPNVVLAAMDADVIKTYVELGMGVGLVASIAYDEARDAGLRAIDARHLFATNMTRLALRRGAYLRRYAYEFIRCFAPPLTPELIGQAMASSEGSRFEI
jgi:LysR family cys regulon transcriptional activator